MTPLREAFVLPCLFLTVALLGGLRLGADVRLVAAAARRARAGGPARWGRSSARACSPTSGSSARAAPGSRTPVGASCCSRSFAASAQVFNLLTPDSGLLHVLVSVFFLVQLLTTLTAVRDRVAMLRSLAVLLGCAFLLRFIALESLYAPGRGVIKRVMTALMEGITLGALDYVPTGPARRDTSRSSPWRSTSSDCCSCRRARTPAAAPQPRSSGSQPSPTSCTETCPRFGASDTRSIAPAASNCSVILRVSSPISVLERARPLLDRVEILVRAPDVVGSPSCCGRRRAPPSSRGRAIRRRWPCGRRARQESSRPSTGRSGASAGRPAPTRARPRPRRAASALRAAPASAAYFLRTASTAASRATRCASRTRT